MTKKFTLTVFVLLFFFFKTFSQTTSSDDRMTQDWISISLAFTGQNVQNGVEASCQLAKCNGEDVVLLRFINHNTEAVKIEWNDAVFTKELKWVSKENVTEKKSLIIKTNETVQGECTGNNQTQLVVKVSDFVKTLDDFKRYGVTAFQVTFIKK